jgi:iron complex transport system ATP-binding protein
MKVTVRDVAVALSGRRVVEDIDLHADSGEVIGLIGPNGSGKSTILRSVYRMLRPVAGRVSLDHRDVWQMTARQSARETAVVAQKLPVDFPLTAREIVAIGRNPHKGPADRENDLDTAIIGEALERTAISELADRDYASLSGGEQQLVHIARALAQTPRVLVLDEPINHLDIRYQLDILETMKRLQVTTILAIHDINLAATYCDRLYVLSGGRIVGAGKPEVMLDPVLLEAVFKVAVTRTTHPVSRKPQLWFSPLDGARETTTRP